MSPHQLNYPMYQEEDEFALDDYSAAEPSSAILQDLAIPQISKTAKWKSFKEMHFHTKPHADLKQMKIDQEDFSHTLKALRRLGRECNILIVDGNKIVLQLSTFENDNHDIKNAYDKLVGEIEKLQAVAKEVGYLISYVELLDTHLRRIKVFFALRKRCKRKISVIYDRLDVRATRSLQLKLNKQEQSLDSIENALEVFENSKLEVAGFYRTHPSTSSLRMSMFELVQTFYVSIVEEQALSSTGKNTGHYNKAKKIVHKECCFVLMNTLKI